MWEVFTSWMLIGSLVMAGMTWYSVCAVKRNWTLSDMIWAIPCLVVWPIILFHLLSNIYKRYNIGEIVIFKAKE